MVKLGAGPKPRALVVIASAFSRARQSAGGYASDTIGAAASWPMPLDRLDLETGSQ
jgi:hypothetical protein